MDVTSAFQFIDEQFFEIDRQDIQDHRMQGVKGIRNILLGAADDQVVDPPLFFPVQDIQAAKEQLEALTPQHEEVLAARDAQVAERKELKARKEELQTQIASLLPDETAEEEVAE